MWTDCAAACKSLGLKEPWADADERALAGLPSSIAAQLLELRFAPSTGFAPLRILLRPDLAPLTVAAIRQHIVGAEGSNPAAVFYRSEAKPAAAPGQCGDILCGPYSLIQGRLEALLDTPSEATPVVRKGFVARIQNGRDFFIALDDHLEWGHSFTVWGEMRDDDAGMATLEAISKLPYHEQKAASASTIMRLLEVEIETTAALVDGRPAQPLGQASRSSGGMSAFDSGSRSTQHVEEMEL